LPEAAAFYDADDRPVVRNRRYAEAFFPCGEDLPRPGFAFERLRAAFARGGRLATPGGGAERRIARQLERHRRPGEEPPGERAGCVPRSLGRASMQRRAFVTLAAGLPLWAAGAARAASLPQPAGPVILRVSGRIRETNAEGGVARFDRPMLEALGVQKLTTSSAWTSGPTEFEGVLASAVLDAVAAEGTAVHATALNDYAVTIPIDELRRYPVLLALKMNGQYLKIMDKGPIWIVYPRDQYREFQDSLTDKKWIWQLHELQVE
jgi:hypothetical protein